MSHVHALARGYSKQDLSRVHFTHGKSEKTASKQKKTILPLNRLKAEIERKRQINAMGGEPLFILPPKPERKRLSLRV